VIQWSLACRGCPRSTCKICNSLDILAAEWGVSRGRRRSPSQKASWLFLRLFSPLAFASYASIRGGGPAEIRGLGPPVDAECRGGHGEVCLGDDFVWR
jgi:hypothetical protein